MQKSHKQAQPKPFLYAGLGTTIFTGLVFRKISGRSLEVTSHDQHWFQSSQLEILGGNLAFPVSCWNPKSWLLWYVHPQEARWCPFQEDLEAASTHEANLAWTCCQHLADKQHSGTVWTAGPVTVRTELSSSSPRPVHCNTISASCWLAFWQSMHQQIERSCLQTFAMLKPSDISMFSPKEIAESQQTEHSWLCTGWLIGTGIPLIYSDSPQYIE